MQDDEQQRRGLRDNYTEYDLQTISLLDLLHGFGAPRHIDFLSIDTEGSELLILQAFDFSRYRFGAITVEHNYSSIREPLHNHLVLHGYRRIWPEISAHDDWYVGNEFRQPSALESAQLISALANLPDNPESPSVRRKIVAGLVG